LYLNELDHARRGNLTKFSMISFCNYVRNCKMSSMIKRKNWRIRFYLLYLVLLFVAVDCRIKPETYPKSMNWKLTYLFYQQPQDLKLGDITIIWKEVTNLEDNIWIEISSDGCVRYAFFSCFADSNFAHKDFSISAEKTRQILSEVSQAIPNLRGRYESCSYDPNTLKIPLLYGHIDNDIIRVRLMSDLNNKVRQVFQPLIEMANKRD